MKRIALTLFLLLAMFSFNINALANSGATIIHNGGSYSGASGKSTSNPNRLLLFGGSYTFRGIRVSFVTSDGVDLFHHDYVVTRQYGSMPNRGVGDGYGKYHYANTACSKIANIKGTTYGGQTCGKLDFSAYEPASVLQKKISTTADLQAIFEKHNFSIGDNFDNYLLTGMEENGTLNNFSAATSGWFTKDSYKYKEGDENYNYDEDLKNLLLEFIDEKYLAEGEIEKIFTVIEPVASYFLQNENYYGSIYELSLLGKTIPGYREGADGKYYAVEGSDCLGWFISYGQKAFQCGGVLDRGLYDSISQLYGEIDGFTENTYFGVINYNNDLITRCATEIVEGVNDYKTDSSKSAYLTEKQITGNYGVGLKVIWIYTVYKPEIKHPKCSEVHKNTNYSSVEVGTLQCELVNDIVSEFNEKAESLGFSLIEESWYRNTCRCQEPINGYNCTPDYKIGTCESKKQIEYNDVKGDETEFWNNCVYTTGDYTIDIHKTSKGAYSYFDSKLTDKNRYCEIYCTESLETDFKVLTSANSYNAGRYIDWPTGTTITGSRTCKVKLTKESWGMYHSELETAVENTITNYNLYSLNKEKYEVLDDYEKTNQNCDCADSSSPSVSCYVFEYETEDLHGGTIDLGGYTQCVGENNYHPYMVGDGIYSTYSITYKDDTTSEKVFNIKYPEPEDKEENNDETDEQQPDNEVLENNDEENLETPEEEKPKTIKVKMTKYTYWLYKCREYYKYYKYDTSKGNVNLTFDYTIYTSNTYSQDEDGELTEGTSNFTLNNMICYNKLQKEINTAKSNMDKYDVYIDYQDAANGYMKQMQKCYTWSNETNKNSIYNFEPEISLKNVDTGYPIPESLRKLESSVIDDTYTTTYKTGKNYCEDNEDYYYNCDDTKCEKETSKVSNCSTESADEESKVKATYEKTLQYSLNSNLYRYILKESNKSIYILPSNINSTDYILMPFGNIPIAYNTKDGEYKISFEYSNLGHKSESSAQTEIDIILEDIYKAESARNEKLPEYGLWRCEYSISSKLITNNTNNSGINIIYRTIDLSNPFPDIDGGGRKVGSNWCSDTGINPCANNNSIVTDVIKTDVMSQEPMYSFTLTPSVIRQIRNYNKGVDEYNNKRTYSDFYLNCEANTGKACLSSFISDLINKNLNGSGVDAKATGKCITGEKNRINDFYGCQN